MKAQALVIFTVLLMTAPATFSAEPKAPKATQPTSEPETTVKKISLDEFDTMRTENKGGDVVVLDVRTPKEFTAGHVPHAVHINWHDRDFNDQVGKLDKSKKYLVYCLSGVRSAAAANRMSTLGFNQLYNFSGGWAAYEKSGKPVEK
jgi:rhodanese-related sulfurtransferase